MLDMGEPIKIDDLARNLIKLSGLRPDVDIKIKYTGLRPGEKLFEEKLMSEEGLQTTANHLIHIAKPIEMDTKAFTTVVNLTNHAYFNLNGEAANECGDHEVWSTAYGHTEVDSNLAATGRTLPVANSPFDLTKGRTFKSIYEDKALPIAFDDNFVIAEKPGKMQQGVFKAVSHRTGITLTVDTDQPGVQFYMGYWLNGEIGKNGAPYKRFGAFCLERFSAGGRSCPACRPSSQRRSACRACQTNRRTGRRT